MQNEIYMDGLYARLDWIEFTIDTVNSDFPTFEHYLGCFGFFSDMFDDTGRGGIGYHRCFRHVSENISVFFEGNSDMGIHFRVTGSAVNYFLDTYLSKYKCDTPFGSIAYDVGDYDATYIVPMLFEYILSVGHFTRLDLAIDDIGCRYYSCKEVADLVSQGLCVSKFKQWRNVQDSSIFNEGRGHTVYFGSRESDVFLRVYDKALEQNISSIAWVRWELEIKHSRADIVARLLVSRDNFGAVAMGILKEYMRFIVSDNSRRCRCSISPRWSDFIKNCSAVSLSLAPVEHSIDKKVAWIDKQVKPTIAGLLVAFDGDISFLTDDLKLAFERLSYKDKKLFKSASAEGGDIDVLS